MSIPDNYEINVSKNHQHYCSIQLSVPFEKDAIKQLNELRTMFGSDYTLTLYHYTCRGQQIGG